MYFMGAFLIGGALSVVAGIVNVFSGIEGAELWTMVAVLAASVIFVCIGILMHVKAKKKLSPELQKRVLRDSFVVCLGLSIRIFLIIIAFFIRTWFELHNPDEYTLEDGRTVYRYPGSDEAYDAYGYKIGKFVDDNKVVLT